jgi:hypothetical protein
MLQQLLGEGLLTRRSEGFHQSKLDTRLTLLRPPREELGHRLTFKDTVDRSFRLES